MTYIPPRKPPHLPRRYRHDDDTRLWGYVLTVVVVILGYGAWRWLHG